MKKISVIIIIYKVKDYLRQCLDSVTSQTYKNLEIIAVAGKDKDGGDDGCEEICREYAARDERIKIITCAAAGVSDARNRGLEAATGDLIGFVDSDDFTDPDMFEHLISLMDEKNADISVCGRYYEFVNKTLSDSPLPDGPKVMDAHGAMEMILSGTGFYLHSWDKLYKKELWDGITFPTALAAPVEAGMMFPTMLRPERRSLPEAPSTVFWVAVAEWTVVMSPSSMPKRLWITFARGARQFVVQDALEITSMAGSRGR